MSQSLNERLSRIHTYWTMICQAHQGQGMEVVAARQQLLERYGKAVGRYLLGALRDREAAEELAQDFALRFAEGAFHRANPERGRFRDFVKGILFRMVADYHRRRKRQPQPLTADSADPASDYPPDDPDGQFAQSWREELLDRSWKALARLQEQTGQQFHTVLRFRAEHAGLRSAQMAEQLSAVLGKEVNAPWVRQTLHRARERFADFLIEEVAQTLEGPSGEELEQELIDLQLLDYCKPALERYRQK
ncbi:MAG: sigma-70 family RNA polymerase sigma factor [Gemmataceae bacterium]|nr:sigma-70 family RNA polymerase sigma factor [Gemmataceae bacterium]